MASSSNIVIAFVAVLWAVAVSAGVTASPVPAAAPSPGSFMQESCEDAGVDAVMCVGPVSETSRLARAFVQQATQNASETAAHLPAPYDSGNLESKPLDVQRCYQGCKKRYEAAVAYLGDAATALEKGKFDDA
eukprot:811561_1